MQVLKLDKILAEISNCSGVYGHGRKVGSTLRCDRNNADSKHGHGEDDPTQFF